MRSCVLELTALAALAAAGCAHAPSSPDGAPTPGRATWPPPPEAPRVAWSAAYPSAAAAPPPKSFWRHLAGAIAGTDDAAEEHVTALERPFGVAASAQAAWIADPEGHRVLRVDWRRNTAQPVVCPGRAWKSPMAVAAGIDGAVFVADDGAIVRVTRGECTDLAPGAMERPTGIALSGGRIYVVDPPRHEVVALEQDGTVALRFGSQGKEEAQLNYPTAIAAGAEGELLVVDALNFRVARFSPDGTFLGALGEDGETAGSFSRPKGIAIDGEGRIYVSDVQRDAILVYARGGTFEFAIGRSGQGAGEFLLPAGLAIDGRTLYVADSYNRRVQVFEIVGDSP